MAKKSVDPGLVLTTEIEVAALGRRYKDLALENIALRGQASKLRTKLGETSEGMALVGVEARLSANELALKAFAKSWERYASARKREYVDPRFSDIGNQVQLSFAWNPPSVQAEGLVKERPDNELVAARKLQAAGRKEWIRVVPELNKNEILNALQERTLEELTKELQRFGLFIEQKDVFKFKVIGDDAERIYADEAAREKAA